MKVIDYDEKGVQYKGANGKTQKRSWKDIEAKSPGIREDADKKSDRTNMPYHYTLVQELGKLL